MVNQTATVTDEDGGQVITQADGTQIVKDSDGSMVMTKPDGSKIVRDSDGAVVVINKNGIKVDATPQQPGSSFHHNRDSNFHPGDFIGGLILGALALKLIQNRSQRKQAKMVATIPPTESGDVAKLRARIATLEAIITDKPRALADEIEQLR